MNFNRSGNAQSRMAAGDVYSLAADKVAATADGDKNSVKQRISSKYNIPANQVDDVYDHMVTRLTQAKLTINFSPKKVFRVTSLVPSKLFKPDSPAFYRSHMPSNSYKNTYQVGNNGKAYMNGRDGVERDLFKYDDIGSLSDIQAIINRITKRALYDGGSNFSFVPSLRPKYGALNVFSHTNGGAGHSAYGESYLVLKEHVKHRCTFTHTDSFALGGADRSANLATILHPDRILLGMRERTFDVLYRRANDLPVSARDLAGHQYVEAQIHTDVLFSRDVEKIRLCKRDLSTGSKGENEACIELIAKFAQKYRIDVDSF